MGALDQVNDHGVGPASNARGADVGVYNCLRTRSQAEILEEPYLEEPYEERSRPHRVTLGSAGLRIEQSHNGTLKRHPQISRQTSGRDRPGTTVNEKVRS